MCTLALRWRFCDLAVNIIGLATAYMPPCLTVDSIARSSIFFTFSRLDTTFNKVTRCLPCMNRFSGQGSQSWHAECRIMSYDDVFLPVDKSAQRVDGTRGNGPVCVAGP